MLVSLSGNGVRFFKSTPDPWYRGTVPGEQVSYVGQKDSATVYQPEEAASTLGCVQQYQFCNPSLPEDSRCGPLASLSDSISGSLTLFNVTEEEFRTSQFTSHRLGSSFQWLLMQLRYSVVGINRILITLGPRALESHKYFSSGLIGELPDNQWQIDVSHWFAIYLASVQAEVVNTAMGPIDPTLSKYTIRPPNRHIQELCQNQVRILRHCLSHSTVNSINILSKQKVLSTEYISFSLFGLYFAYISGVLIFVISYVLEPIFACLYHRRKYGEYTYLEWAATETLQLQRASYQGIGSGTWFGHTKTVPMTRRGEMLGNLPMYYSEPRSGPASLAGSSKSFYG